MKIHHKDGRVLHTRCRGCMCHELPMSFGVPRDGACNECGCPTNEAGFTRIFEHMKQTDPDRATRVVDPDGAGRTG